MRVAVASHGDGRRLGELMATGDPATGEVRRPPGIDAVQRQTQTRLEPGRRRSQRLHGVDLIVVDDQRRAIGVPQPRHGQIDPLLGEIQFAALHRPGAVEDERDVEGRRATSLSLVLGRGDDAYQQRRFATAGRDQRLLPPRLDAGSLLAARASPSDGFLQSGVGWNRSS